MTRITRLLIVDIMMTGLIGMGGPVIAASGDGLAIDRVRSSNAVIVKVLKEASDRSRTFRGLVETIKASDGTVYVEEGKCGYGVRACLVTVTMAGANRNLWVKVDTRLADCELMELIGHELQHTIEVLGDRTVTNGFALYYFFLKEGSRSKGLAFETDAAIAVGETVRAEVRKYGSCSQAR